MKKLRLKAQQRELLRQVDAKARTDRAARRVRSLEAKEARIERERKEREAGGQLNSIGIRRLSYCGYCGEPVGLDDIKLREGRAFHTGCLKKLLAF